VASQRRERSDKGQAGTSWRAAIGIDVCVFLMCGALVALWGRETISSIPNAEATGVFRAWQDYFLHASEITYLRDYPAFGRHAQYLAGAPQPLYHRASYAMSALFSAVGGMPSLETATTFWMPAGLLLCMLATYALGCALETATCLKPRRGGLPLPDVGKSGGISSSARMVDAGSAGDRGYVWARPSRASSSA
jgi:hypothetical protein